MQSINKPLPTNHQSPDTKQADLVGQGYAAVVLATGVMPRRVKIPGIEHPKVLSYVDVLRHNKPVKFVCGRVWLFVCCKRV